MRRRDAPGPRLPSPEIARFIVDVAVVLEAAVAAYDDLLDAPEGDLRTATALHHARELALAGRDYLIFSEQLDGLPMYVHPHHGIHVAQRLGPAFIALAQQPTDAPTLLTRGQLRQLLEEPEFEKWWGWCLNIADRDRPA